MLNTKFDRAMREVSDVLGGNTSVAWMGLIAFVITKVVESVNDLVSTFTGIAALILLVLTIIGKYNEITGSKRVDKGGDKAAG